MLRYPVVFTFLLKAGKFDNLNATRKLRGLMILLLLLFYCFHYIIIFSGIIELNLVSFGYKDIGYYNEISSIVT